MKYLVPALLLSTAIMVLCVTPLDQMEMNVSMNDKVAHIIAFFPLSASYAWGFRRQKRWKFLHRNAFAVAFIWSALYGGLIEVIQANWVPMRMGDPYDFVADSIGSLLGIGLYMVGMKTALKRFL